MKLADRILNERISSLEQLAPADRELVQADPGLTALLADNAALQCVREDFPPAPPWENLRADVIAESTKPKEQPMSLITRMMSGRTWYVRAALGVLIVAALLATSLLLPRNGSLSPLTPAWAASDGYMLTYVLPAPGDPCEPNPMLQSMEQVVKDWVEASKAAREAAADNEGEPARILFKGLFENGEMHLTIMAVNVTVMDMESLRDELSTVTGFPEPSIEEATWFHMEELKNADCISVNLQDRVFNFPPSSTEEEIETLLNEWINTEHPDAGLSVDVEVFDDGERKEIKLMIRGTDIEICSNDEFVRE